MVLTLTNIRPTPKSRVATTAAQTNVHKCKSIDYENNVCTPAAIHILLKYNEESKRAQQSKDGTMDLELDLITVSNCSTNSPRM